MGEWILILTLVSGSTRAVEVSPIPFLSEDVCEKAGETWADQADPKGLAIGYAKYVCVSRGREI